jgi:hypothetical protein
MPSLKKTATMASKLHRGVTTDHPSVMKLLLEQWHILFWIFTPLASLITKLVYFGPSFYRFIVWLIFWSVATGAIVFAFVLRWCTENKSGIDS